MKITDRKKFIVLEYQNDDIKDFASNLTIQIPKNHKGKNIAINLLDFNSLELPELLLFLKASNQHRASKKSFVIVNQAINPDDVPSEMIVVPTLREAEDIIEMEEIERDLGF